MSKIQKTCVKCKKNQAVSPYTPFCSERCQLLDFSDWSSENYRIPVVSDEIVEEIKNDDSDA